MKKGFFLLVLVFTATIMQAQVVQTSFNEKEMMQELLALKKTVNDLQQDKLQTDRARYKKNYDLLLNGLEIIKDIHLGTVEISAARNNNMMYKKLIDVNNPTSDILGFQLQDVLNKTLEDNINQLPIIDTEKNRLKLQVSNLFEGLKKTFPPLQIITSAFSVISSFTSFKTDKLAKKGEMIIEAVNPISPDVLQKITGQLQPYISFYADLNKLNNNYETALYQHEVEYRDFMLDIIDLRTAMEKKIDINGSIAMQLITLFDLDNSSMQNFNYKSKMENETIRELTTGCSNITDLVDRYKKFTNDFITIQDDFYRQNRELLLNNAKKLPYKDEAKIDLLLSDLDKIAGSSNEQKKTGFDAGYRLRLKGILIKLYNINNLRI